MLERRQAPRQRIFLRGLVYFNNRQSAVDCLIRDISDLGARLKFPDSVVLPDAIELYIPQKDQTLSATVRRRTGSEVGIAFNEPRRASSKPDTIHTVDLTERVRKLEAEVVALRRMLRRLKTVVEGNDIDAA